MPDFAQRRAKALKLLAKSEASALLVTNFTNVTYLTGFTGDDSYLILSPDKLLLVTDGRYTEQLESECPGLDLHVRGPGSKMIEGLIEIFRNWRPGSLAVEGETMTVALWEQLSKALPAVRFSTSLGLIEELRQIKDKEEIDEIRHSVWLAERAFAVARSGIHPQRTERQIANQIEYQIRDMGGKGCAFESIVGVGPRAALPHGRPTDVPTGDADFTLIDWGAQGRLYKSDLTRIVVTGKISPKLERVYGVVLRAQEAAIKAIKPGAAGNEIDAVARKVIADAGFDKAFNHGLGHGIGLNIHEGPRLSKVTTEPLRPGMVVTVEPGIYLPGWGGVRIEDDVLVTRTGHEVLTSVPKSLADSVLI